MSAFSEDVAGRVATLQSAIWSLEKQATCPIGNNPLKRSRLLVKARMIESSLSRGLDAYFEGNREVALRHLEQAEGLTKKLVVSPNKEESCTT